MKSTLELYSSGNIDVFVNERINEWMNKWFNNSMIKQGTQDVFK